MAQLLRDGIFTPATEPMSLDLLREPLPSLRQGVLEALLREREEVR